MPSFNDFVKPEPEEEPATISIACEECMSYDTDTKTSAPGVFSAYCRRCGYVTKIEFDWMK